LQIRALPGAVADLVSRQAMKRFSWVIFVSVSLLHIYGTSELLGAGIRASKAVAYGQTEQGFVWLTVWSWICQPILMLLNVF
jgi:hypothetical protein